MLRTTQKPLILLWWNLVLFKRCLVTAWTWIRQPLHGGGRNSFPNNSVRVQTLTCHPDMIKLCRLLILFCIYCFNGQNQFLPVEWMLYSHFLQQKPLTKSLPCLWLLSSRELTVKVGTMDFRKVEPVVWSGMVWQNQQVERSSDYLFHVLRCGS